MNQSWNHWTLTKLTINAYITRRLFFVWELQLLVNNIIVLGTNISLLYAQVFKCTSSKRKNGSRGQFTTAVRNSVSWNFLKSFIGIDLRWMWTCYSPLIHFEPKIHSPLSDQVADPVQDWGFHGTMPPWLCRVIVKQMATELPVSGSATGVSHIRYYPL